MNFKRLILIGIALIFSIAIIVGVRFDLYSYIEHISVNLPSLSEVFNDLNNAVEYMQSADINFFQSVFQWFVVMWQWFSNRICSLDKGI